MHYHHLVLWSVEPDRPLSCATAEDDPIRQAHAKRSLADAPQRASKSTWRRFLRRRTVATGRP